MMGCSVNLSARLMASAPKNTIQARGYGKGYAHGGYGVEAPKTALVVVASL